MFGVTWCCIVSGCCVPQFCVLMFPGRNFLSRDDSFMLLGLVFVLFLLSCLCLVVLGTSEACGFDFVVCWFGGSG